MRIRATRASLVFALTAAVAFAGIAGTHMRAPVLMRPIAGTVAAQAHAAAEGLPGLHVAFNAHKRVAAVDVVPAPAALLVMLFVLGVVVRRSRPLLRVVTATVHARGPPVRR